jgi:tRNA-dihydrouridine synthase 1
LEAALLVQDRCDAVDINLGCPQGIAKRGRYGAFLMEELDLLSSIVSTLSAGLKIPVTCKTRIYRNDFERSVKLCETLVAAGASMLTIHGRSREEKGNLVAGCDWAMIARLKAHFGDRVPIIANGGIECLDDIHKCLEETGADGVMTSEAILENPALFSRNLNENKEYRTLVDLAEEYLYMALKYSGSQIKTTRNHMMKFFYKYFIKHPDLRDRTAMTNNNEGFQLIINELRLRISDSDNDYNESWYKRYRNADSDAAHNGHHVTQGDDKSFINWQTIALDKQKDKFWSTVEDDTDGVFDCLGMFNE